MPPKSKAGSKAKKGKASAQDAAGDAPQEEDTTDYSQGISAYEIPRATGTIYALTLAVHD